MIVFSAPNPPPYVDELPLSKDLFESLEIVRHVRYADCSGTTEVKLKKYKDGYLASPAPFLRLSSTLQPSRYQGDEVLDYLLRHSRRHGRCTTERSQSLFETSRQRFEFY